MGVIAFVRQAFLDAQHYGAVRRLQPGARQNAADDPAFDAMQPALEGKLPVAFEANEAREILRALKMARELKLDPIVTGARGADEVTADLKAQNARVIWQPQLPAAAEDAGARGRRPVGALRERAGAPKARRRSRAPAWHSGSSRPA
jgi:hypothetical protein